MENTVDLILRHGEQSPQALVNQIQAGVDVEASRRAADEELARQLAQQQQRSQTGVTTTTSTTTGSSSSSSTTDTRTPKGPPTSLPPDFLRLSNSSTTTTSNSLADDEALARMLQDELFSEELSRNPEFSHLARGRPRTVGGIPISPATRHLAHANAHDAAHSSNTPQVNIMEALSSLGGQAKRNLQVIAAKFQQQGQAMVNNTTGGGGGTSSAATSPSGAASERRGLLDDTDDMELAARKEL